MKPKKSDLDAVYGLAPAEAIKYFESLGYEITHDWLEAAQAAQNQAFTVAKAVKMDVLQGFRAEIEKSLRTGETFETFKKNINRKIQRQGWSASDGKPWRLETIYRTNIQTAYSVGRDKQFIANKTARPYLERVAIIDEATRDSHAALNGVIRPVEDPFWDTRKAPMGYNCRCRDRALTEDQARVKGITVNEPEEKADPGFQFNPTKRPWKPKKSDYDPDIWEAANEDNV